MFFGFIQIPLKHVGGMVSVGLGETFEQVIHTKLFFCRRGCAFNQRAYSCNGGFVFSRCLTKSQRLGVGINSISTGEIPQLINNVLNAPHQAGIFLVQRGRQFAPCGFTFGCRRFDEVIFEIGFGVWFYGNRTSRASVIQLPVTTLILSDNGFSFDFTANNKCCAVLRNNTTLHLSIHSAFHGVTHFNIRAFRALLCFSWAGWGGLIPRSFIRVFHAVFLLHSSEKILCPCELLSLLLRASTLVTRAGANQPPRLAPIIKLLLLGGERFLSGFLFWCGWFHFSRARVANTDLRNIQHDALQKPGSGASIA